MTKVIVQESFASVNGARLSPGQYVQLVEKLPLLLCLALPVDQRKRIPSLRWRRFFSYPGGVSLKSATSSSMRPVKLLLW